MFFAYNRPDHTLRSLESLMQNAEAAESTLYIFCDAAKQQATPADLNSIAKVRAVVKSKKWCGKVEVIEREKNLGLAASVIDGVLPSIPSLQ